MCCATTGLLSSPRANTDHASSSVSLVVSPDAPVIEAVVGSGELPRLACVTGRPPEARECVRAESRSGPRALAHAQRLNHPAVSGSAMPSPPSPPRPACRPRSASSPPSFPTKAWMSAKSRSFDYARRGVIPGHKLGRRWVFLHDELDEALRSAPRSEVSSPAPQPPGSQAPVRAKRTLKRYPGAVPYGGAGQ